MPFLQHVPVLLASCTRKARKLSQSLGLAYCSLILILRLKLTVDFRKVLRILRDVVQHQNVSLLLFSGQIVVVPRTEGERHTESYHVLVQRYVHDNIRKFTETVASRLFPHIPLEATQSLTCEYWPTRKVIHRGDGSDTAKTEEERTKSRRILRKVTGVLAKLLTQLHLLCCTRIFSHPRHCRKLLPIETTTSIRDYASATVQA